MLQQQAQAQRANAQTLVEIKALLERVAADGSEQKKLLEGVQSEARQATSEGARACATLDLLRTGQGTA